jgi:3-hydroxymyristoyl/3-hydroxydecanoyl-(acyl carrier protein) dehydratase/1-acyl-sn-glycerol-3-phosphate acyltransferase
MWAMLDRITGFWPQAGAAELGRLRGEKDVNPEEWFFKAHFFQDPVMPGTLGIDSMVQLVKFYMLSMGLHAGMENPRFTVLTAGRPVTWKYRGQVQPHRKRIVVEAEIVDIKRERESLTAIADAWLWVDGVRVYRVEQLAVQLTSALLTIEAELSGSYAGSLTDARSLQPDLQQIKTFWTGLSKLDPPPMVEKFFFNLCRHFLKRVVLTDPAKLRELHGRPVIFLANHQVLLESFLFSVVAPAFTGSPILALAKKEQKDSVLVQTAFAACSAFAGTPDDPIVYFDRSNPAALLPILQRFGKALTDEGRSILVHVEGVRARSCRTSVQTISGALPDLAIKSNVPIVPVRFAGGLPVEPLAKKLDFPWRYGAQEYFIGTPIEPTELASLPLRERKERVLAAINRLREGDQEEPSAGDPLFESRVRRRSVGSGISETEAVLIECAELGSECGIEELFHAERRREFRREVEEI